MKLLDTLLLKLGYRRTHWTDEIANKLCEEFTTACDTKQFHTDSPSINTYFFIDYLSTRYSVTLTVDSAVQCAYCRKTMSQTLFDKHIKECSDSHLRLLNHMLSVKKMKK